jgi:nitrogen fixation protein FixH
MISGVLKSKKGGNVWAFFPVGLLLAMFVGWGLMLSIALDDPAFGVEPDYYDKALKFDAQQALERDSRRLGWSLDLEIQPTRRDAAELIAIVRDRSGAPIDAARVSLSAFHNARSSNIVELVLQPKGNGRYSGPLTPARAGLWEFRFQVDKGSDRFLRVVRSDVNVAGAP